MESRQEISKWIASRGSDIMIALEMKDNRKDIYFSEANPALSLKDKGTISRAISVNPSISGRPTPAANISGGDSDDPQEVSAELDIQSNPLKENRSSLSDNITDGDHTAETTAMTSTNARIMSTHILDLSSNSTMV